MPNPIGVPAGEMDNNIHSVTQNLMTKCIGTEGRIAARVIRYRNRCDSSIRA